MENFVDLCRMDCYYVKESVRNPLLSGDHYFAECDAGGGSDSGKNTRREKLWQWHL